MLPVHTEQRLNINPTYITSTAIWSGNGFKRSHRQLFNQKNLQDNTHKGKLSGKAQTKLRNAVNWLVESSQYKPLWWEEEKKFIYFKVNFITLTIPKQQTEDGEISGKLLQKMLNTFLTYSRKAYFLDNYVWKIERGKLGKLHVHLSTDTFFHWRKLRTTWNRIMQSEGLLDSYHSEHGHYDPNSTDVHAVKGINNLASYLCKYMAKDSGLSEKYKNRIWGASSSLTGKCQHIVGIDECSDAMKPLMRREIEWKVIEGKEDLFGRKSKLGEIFFMTRESWKLIGECDLKKVYNEHRFSIRHNTRKLPAEYAIINDVPKSLAVFVLNSPADSPVKPEPILKIERGKSLVLELFE